MPTICNGPINIAAGSAGKWRDLVYDADTAGQTQGGSREACPFATFRPDGDNGLAITATMAATGIHEVALTLF